MNERKLTEEQIESLFDFCKKHYVPYYDLQIELVDHLAAGIENTWGENDKLSFDDALNAQFNKFGIHGFSHVKREKKKALLRKYRRIQWQLIGEFYTIPKIFMTIAITFLLFTCFRLAPNNNRVAFISLSTFCIIFLIYYLFHYKKSIKLNLVPEQKFLISDVHKATMSGFIAFSFLPLHLYNMSNGNFTDVGSFIGNALFQDLILSFLITFYAIIIIVMAVYVPKRIKADFESEFPKFVKS